MTMPRRRRRDALFLVPPADFALYEEMTARRLAPSPYPLLVRWPETFTGSAEALSCLGRGG